MKYLNLTNTEVKVLLQVRREQFASYGLTLLLITGISYLLLQLILKPYASIFLVFFLAVAYIAYILRINRKYLMEIFRKQKKVYRGALSFKIIYRRNKRRKYVFNVDGKNFYVDRKNFEYIQEGDIVEFHVSSSTKHLYKVEKIPSIG